MMLFIGIVLIVAALAVSYWVGRRNFNRRNAFGNQAFRSYGHALLTRTGEKLARLAAIVLFALGLLCLLAYYSYDPNLGKTASPPPHHHKGR